MTDYGPYLGKNPETVPISNSEIQLFKTCRRAWWLTYYRGLQKKTREVVGPLPLGTRVHEALEVYYRDNEDPVAEYVRLLSEDRLLAEQQSGGTQELMDEFDKEGELGRIMIEGYVQWVQEEHIDVDYEIIGVEQASRYKVMNGRVELIGKTDLRLLDKRDDTVYVGDFKTAAQMKQFYDISHMSEQLMLYTLLERLQNGDSAADGGVYIILKKVKRTAKAKPPFYEKITVRFNDQTMNSFWIRLHGTLRDMMNVRDELDAGADHRYVAYPTVTKDCVWRCPFFDVCPMFDDGGDAERWIDQYTEVGNPYERYDNLL